ncbi:MAG: hypothetical protein A2X74_06485 [Polynucleobacter sp. GWA2_45_21]|nr:MAG: hypothetical protein A2X74_06485 [Polynucleobacter sp. GWA2_45_21]HBK43478.1 hypothetical protein [Polynucleobacter sp.]
MLSQRESHAVALLVRVSHLLLPVTTQLKHSNSTYSCNCFSLSDLTFVTKQLAKIFMPAKQKQTKIMAIFGEFGQIEVDQTANQVIN